MKFTHITLLSIFTLTVNPSAQAKEHVNIMGRIILKGDISPTCKVTLNGKASETITYNRDALIDLPPITLAATCNKHEDYSVQIEYPIDTAGQGILTSDDGQTVPFTLKIGGVPVANGYKLAPIGLSIDETLTVDFSSANALPVVKKGDYKGSINFTITSGS